MHSSRGLSICLASVAFVSLLLAGCHRSGDTQLIDGFHSYETLEQVKSRLSNIDRREQWREEKQEVDPSDRRPAHLFVHLIGNFKHVGQQGILDLTFYNNRLMETQFSPYSGELYKDALRKQGLPVPPEPGKQIRISPRTTFSYYNNSDGTFRFVWDDSALEQEWNDWVAKYS